MTKNVVVVESPAKAKTINKYLGTDYEVLASYGHVRDLPSKDGSVDTDNDFAMRWQSDSNGKKRISDISKAIKGAERLYLATDPDREGEAISWHIIEELSKGNKLKNIDIQRIVFHEVTKSAVTNAIASPRSLNKELVDAYLARRALDYLVGFNLSPVLWRKLPGAKSAGRVQSVALRLICERETEIEKFKSEEYWSVTTAMETKGEKTVKGQPFEARLTHMNDKKLGKMDLQSQSHAETAVSAINSNGFTVTSVEKKAIKRNPFGPFTTSTLQQEASRKLGFGSSKTMMIAQRLYEGITLGGETVGLITYMRTDGMNLSGEALTQTRGLIADTYGDSYLPNSPRIYKTKAKNAQEAHEAIRPTSLSRRPEHVAKYLDSDQSRLYDLIWKRTIACQMQSATLNQVIVVMDNGQATLRATGSTIAFDGFMRVYFETDEDKTTSDKDETILPVMQAGDAVTTQTVTPEQHFTSPPPRYTEASLVKRMEELGIGRPSTYASIIKVLQDRSYVQVESRRFFPKDRGRLVTSFLSSFFDTYFQYDFTADLEEKLDHISAGNAEWKAVLHQFWQSFKPQTEKVLEFSPQEVRDAIDKDLGTVFFPETDGKTSEQMRQCPKCDDGRLSLNFGRYGAYIACSNYPDCKYSRDINQDPQQDLADAHQDLPKVLGTVSKDTLKTILKKAPLDEVPNSALEVILKKGPYGLYVQLGEEKKPKRASLLKGWGVSDITLEKALALLSLPRDVGVYPETGEVIKAGIGRFGPFLLHDKKYTSLPADDDVLTVGLNRACELIAQAIAKEALNKPIELGNHPDDGEPITVQKGRFGPYVKHGRTNAPLPRGTEMADVTLDQAIDLINAKKANKKTKVKKSSKKTSKKKSSAKKSTIKKATTKK